MSHVTQQIVQPIIDRFGEPEEWLTEVALTERDRAVLGLGGSGRTHDVTFAVLRTDGRLVGIRKPSFPDGAWRIPSGGIRPGEAFEAGVAREAGEETGLAIKLTGYPLVARARLIAADGESIDWVTHVVTAEPRGSTRLAPRDRREIESARWLTIDELTGPVARVLRATGGGLFAYRADLHDRLRRLMAG